MILMRIASFVFILLSVAHLSGCARGPVEPVRVGSLVWPGYEPLFLARSLKYLDEQEVQLVELTSASEVIRAFRNGAIEAGTLTLDEVLSLISYGIDLRVVLVMDVSNGADVILGRQGIHSIRDLKNRRVGVENSALGAYFLSRALKLEGLTFQEVKVVPLEVSEHEKAFLGGSVDAVVTFEPVRTRLLAKGGRILFDSTRIPGEIVDVLAVRADSLRRQPVEIRALLIGWFRALEFLREHPEEAARRMSVRLKISPQETRTAFQGLHLPGREEVMGLLNGREHSLRTTSGELVRVMREQKLLDKDVDIGVLIDPEPLRNLAR